MTAQEAELLAEPKPYLLTIEERVEEDFYYRHLGQKAMEYWLSRDGVEIGELFWEVNELDMAVCDGINLEPGVEELTDEDWSSVVLCMHGLTKVKHITYPGGQQVFLEAI